ncbi:MAG TPA: NAD(P)-dependent alcohol dehydrogenase [Myxococcaceae bacterium]|nr:NAD(P)-dependent alcohol dehydrogenase [Myxococcaceae bacterium]
MKVPAYAAATAGAPLGPFTVERRDLRPDDLQIDILFCGICHSDIHQARDEWGGALFPMVPGHEIVGRVTRIGAAVTKFKVGDLAGVGCMVDACGRCDPCRRGTEQFCTQTAAFTYNGTEMDRTTPTYGGYSTAIVVREPFVLRIPAGLDPAGAAPLLCAGITTYSPLRQWGVKAGQKVGVVGLGGLGHVGVKLARSMGAEVTMFSTSLSKQKDAERLGATGFVLTRDPAGLKAQARKFDFLLDTVSAEHDIEAYLSLLRPGGTMAMVGVPPEKLRLSAFSLVAGSKRLVGSFIGGIPETQEMLDHCGKHGIVADVEIIPVQQVNEAYERTVKGDVKYRFSIDLTSLKK